MKEDKSYSPVIVALEVKIMKHKYLLLEIQPPYGWLLSSSCGGKQPLAAQKKGPSGQKVILPDERMDNRFKGFRFTYQFERW